jgi:hypothetical protein
MDPWSSSLPAHGLHEATGPPHNPLPCTHAGPGEAGSGGCCRGEIKATEGQPAPDHPGQSARWSSRIRVAT